MRTESSSAIAPTVKRVLSRLAVAKRSAWAQRPAMRWLAVLGIVVVIGGLGYLTTLPSPGKYLGEGRVYSEDAITSITRALAAADLGYRVEENRIGVAADSYTEAMGVVAKLNVNPRSIPEIRKEAQTGGLWATPKEQEKRELRAKEEILETLIADLDEMVSAVVMIERTQTRTGVRPTTSTTAFVRLETKGSRELVPKTVQKIKGIIVGIEPALKPDAIAVWDTTGRNYLDPLNPKLDELSRVRAREEELAQEIREHVSWVAGAEVRVKMVEPPATEPEAPVQVKEEPIPAALPRVGVNQPVDAAVEPAPLEKAPPAAEPEPPAKAEFARIWVTVPRSFYLRKALPNRNPSSEDLQAIQGRTEVVIKRAAGYVLPPDSFEISVDTIPDDMVLRDPSVAPAVPESRRIPSWWVPAGVGAGVAAVLLIVGLRLLAARRPSRAVAAVEPARVRFAVEAAEESGSGPGASERVRELIRHNPEAAAGVLHRWIGQGGHAA